MSVFPSYLGVSHRKLFSPRIPRCAFCCLCIQQRERRRRNRLQQRHSGAIRHEFQSFLARREKEPPEKKELISSPSFLLPLPLSAIRQMRVRGRNPNVLQGHPMKRGSNLLISGRNSTCSTCSAASGSTSIESGFNSQSGDFLPEILIPQIDR